MTLYDNFLFPKLWYPLHESNESMFVYILFAEGIKVLIKICYNVWKIGFILDIIEFTWNKTFLKTMKTWKYIFFIATVQVVWDGNVQDNWNLRKKSLKDILYRTYINLYKKCCSDQAEPNVHSMNNLAIKNN